MIRAVFFDAVGTLIHPAVPAPRKYAEVAARYGCQMPADEIRGRFLEAFREGERHDRVANWATSEEREIERWRRIVAGTISDDEDCFRELYDHYALPEAWAVDADAAPVFAGLSARGLVIGLASNYDSRLESVVEGHAELRGLRPNIVISSRVGHRKPGGAFFEAVKSLVGFSADEIAFVGDDVENDYEGARAARMTAILLDPRGRYPAIGNRIAKLHELLTSESL